MRKENWIKDWSNEEKEEKGGRMKADAKEKTRRK